MNDDLYDPQTRKWNVKEVLHRSKSAFAILLSLAVLITGGVLVYKFADKAWTDYRTTEDYIGEGVDPVEVTIPPGTSLSGIGDLLVTADVVKTAKAWDRAVAKVNGAERIQAGRYRLKTQVPAALAVQMLMDPKNIIRNRMTLKEGLRLTAAVKVMAKAAGIKDTALTAALKTPGNLGLPAWAKGRAEGFFFPDTYELPTKPTAAAVINLTTTQFSRVTDDINFEGRAKDIKRTPYDALIVASIIEAEVNKPEYRAKVARVLYNRLDKGMPLQLDTTVLYANNIEGHPTTTNEQRANPSPYNTYVHTGLPPGPINSPGRAALEAAVNPEAGAWLYFVAVNLDTGETLFANTYAEHLQNVAKFQAWCQAHPGKC